MTKISGFRFTDGTALYIAVREAKPRERVQEIGGYDRLCDKASHHKMEGFIDVLDPRL